jgi:uncharacterized protein
VTSSAGASTATARGPLLKLALVGLAAGFLSGLFGVGGGLLIVPGLVLVLGMGQRLAHGTSLAAIVPIAISGVIGFALEDAVDWPVAAALVIGSAVGAVIGTRLLHVLPAKVLAYTFVVLLLATSVRLIFDRSDAAGRGDIDVAMVAGLIFLGVLAGTLAGLLGVGGGIIMVPAMVLLYGIPAAVAKGTSLAVIIPTALVATTRNLRVGNVDLRAATVVGLSGVVSSYLASKISIGLDENLSNALFAGLLVVTGIRMAITARRRTPGPPIEGEV